MKGKRLLQLIFWLPLWGLLAGEAQSATFRDMLGRPVAVPDRPLRLVSLAPSLTEIVFALGRQDWLVGVTDFCDFPKEARAKPKVGGFMRPDVERVVWLRPDLMLATAERDRWGSLSSLERLGLPVYTVQPEGISSTWDAIRRLGQVLQAIPQAETLVQHLQKETEAVRRRVAGRPRLRVLYLMWADPPIAAGAGSVIGDLITAAGGENVLRQRHPPYLRLGWEQLLLLAPQVIVVATMGGEVNPDRRRWEPWQSIPAIRAGRIHAVLGDTIHRPGPRLAEGLALLARAIHPEVFAADLAGARR